MQHSYLLLVAFLRGHLTVVLIFERFVQSWDSVSLLELNKAGQILFGTRQQGRYEMPRGDSAEL